MTATMTTMSALPHPAEYLPSVMEMPRLYVSSSSYIHNPYASCTMSDDVDTASSVAESSVDAHLGGSTTANSVAGFIVTGAPASPEKPAPNSSMCSPTFSHGMGSSATGSFYTNPVQNQGQLQGQGCGMALVEEDATAAAINAIAAVAAAVFRQSPAGTPLLRAQRPQEGVSPSASFTAYPGTTTPPLQPLDSAFASTTTSPAALRSHAIDSPNPQNSASVSTLSAGAVPFTPPAQAPVTIGRNEETGEAPVKLFVGQVPLRQDVQSWLEEKFSPYGLVRMHVRNNRTAFIWVQTQQAAEAALRDLHGLTYVNGRMEFQLTVERPHTHKQEKPEDARRRF